MWIHEKRLQFPVKIAQTCPKTTSLIINQLDSLDDGLTASMRCLSQHYTVPYREVDGLLADIGTEELAHLEMVCAIIYQLTKNLTSEQAKAVGFGAYYIDRTTALWLTAATGVPFNACKFQSKGDAIIGLYESLMTEQKARTTYNNLIRIIESPRVREPFKFLHAREIIHFRCPEETLEKIRSKSNEENFYYFSPEFDK